MAENSKIQWTHHTFNPWRGCTKVSAGCANCYAETLSGRNPKTLGVWGPNGTRVVASEAMWREPVKWSKEAAAAGERRRVFCASLADVFEDWQGPMTGSGGTPLYVCSDKASTDNVAWEELPVQDGWQQESPVRMDDARSRLFGLIGRTRWLDWLLLTKRPENVARMTRDWIGFGERLPGNVWIGTSVENQAAADERIPHLLRVPAAVRFLSCEPLLGPIEFGDRHNLHGGIHWGIIGGESGPDSRVCRVEWVRDIARQFDDAAVSVFVKQLGVNVTTTLPDGEAWPGHTGPTSRVQFSGDGFGNYHVSGLTDKKGGDPAEWPADLRVRELPQAVPS